MEKEGSLEIIQYIFISAVSVRTQNGCFRALPEPLVVTQEVINDQFFSGAQ